MNKEYLNILELDVKKESLNSNEINYLDTLSKEEIKELLDYHDTEYNVFNAMQNGRKLSLNSIYGSFGNPYFVCSTPDIAGAITAMGRDAIKYMDEIAETYAYDIWHLDEELHEHLGIKTEDIKPLDPTWIHRESKTDYDGIPTQQEIEDGLYQRKISVLSYIDTDSAFFTFLPLMNSCNWKGDPQEFIEKIAKFRLEPLFKKKLDNYAKKYNVTNIQDFELENINESILFLAKKQYIKHTIWEDGTQYPRLHNIAPKGVPLIQKGTPPFAKEKIMEIIHYLFDNHKTYKLQDIMKFVKDIKKQFELANIESICKSTNCNKYWSDKIIVDGRPEDGPGIIDEVTNYKYAKGTYYVVKAMGYYNYLLNQHPELKSKYEYIRPGTKVKYYFCKNGLNERFAYPIGAFPHEFAPEVDKDTHFTDIITDGINRYIKALGMPEINKRLSCILPIF